MALIDKASLLMVPSTYEDGTLYNVLPSGNKAPDETGNHNGYDQTRADFTFSRGFNLTATRVNANGLIEKGRENLLTYSNDFSDSDWEKSDVTITSGFEGYDGTNNAWELTRTATAYARMNQAVTQSGVYTHSIYAKAGTLNWISIGPSGGGEGTWFNLSNGTIGVEGSLIKHSSIESIGNGWYRISVVVNNPINQWFRFYPSDVDGGDESTTATGTIYVQNAQLEKGLVSTPYIETGATTATAGVLENTPRIDYSSGAGALLLEPQRTNVMPYSEYFEAWDTTGSITRTTNYGISPEGVKNSTRVQFSGASQELRDVASVVAGNVASIYIKGTAGETIKFGSALAEEIITLNGEWQRLEKYNAAATNKITINTYSGATARDIEVWGAQLEAGSHVSSYVPTYGSAATRGADSCTGGGDSDSINSTEGVLYAEVSALANDGTFRQMTISNGTNDNRFSIDWTSTDNQIRCYIETQDVSQGSMTASVSDATDYHKIAVKYKANDFALWVDGSEQATNTSAAVPLNINQVRFDNSTGSNSFVGNVKQLAVFDEALSDSELATLTTL